MKNLKIFLMLFFGMAFIEVLIMVICMLFVAFFNWEMIELPILNENTFKNIRGFVICNFIGSILYFFLIKLMNTKFKNTSS